jgi:hypothetical protein
VRREVENFRIVREFAVQCIYEVSCGGALIDRHRAFHTGLADAAFGVFIEGGGVGTLEKWQRFRTVASLGKLQSVFR